MNNTWMLLKNVPFNSLRSLEDVVKLPEESLVKLVEKKQKKDSTLFLYMIRNSDSLLAIRKFGDGEDIAELQTNLLLITKNISDEVGKLSRKYVLPYKVAKILGTDEKKYESLKNALKEIGKATIKDLKDLKSASCIRRHEALMEVLGERTCNIIALSSLNRVQKEQLCQFVFGKCMHKLNRNKTKPIPKTNKEYISFENKTVNLDTISIDQVRRLRQVSKKEGLKEILCEYAYKAIDVENRSSFEIDRIAYLVWSRCIYELN